MNKVYKSRIVKAAPPINFFNRARRTGVSRPDYTTIERREIVPANPSSTSAFTLNNDEDTIVVDTHVPFDDDFDELIPDIPIPTFEALQLSEEETRATILKWKESRTKLERKPRDFSSYVYYYIQR